jgi:hypothetical protein
MSLWVPQWGFGFGMYCKLQTVVRADHRKAAADVTIEVAKENLSANRDAVETG